MRRTKTNVYAHALSACRTPSGTPGTGRTHPRNTPHGDTTHRLSNNRGIHFRHTAPTLRKHNRHFKNPATRRRDTPRHIDLEDIPVRLHRTQIQAAQHISPVRAESCGHVMHADPQHQPRIPRTAPRNQIPIPRPALRTAAGHTTRTNHQIHATITPYYPKHPRQILRPVRPIHIHLAHHVIPTVKRPRETRQIRGSQPALTFAMHHIDMAVVPRHPVGKLTGTVRRTIIDHQHVNTRIVREHTIQRGTQILPLVVRGHHHTHAAADRRSQFRRCRHASPFTTFRLETVHHCTRVCCEHADNSATI